MTEFVDDVEDQVTEAMPFLDKQLNAGYGVKMASADRVRALFVGKDGQTHGIDELPNEGVLPSAVKLIGLPKVGGASADESCRWVRDDKNPSYVNGVTLDNIDYAAFLENFDVYAIAKHAYHEFTRFFEGEMQRRVCGLERKAFWRQYMNTPGQPRRLSFAMRFIRPHRRHEASARRAREQGHPQAAQAGVGGSAGWHVDPDSLREGDYQGAQTPPSTPYSPSSTLLTLPLFNSFVR